MTTLPTFADTVAPTDLLAKLDVQRSELEARKAATNSRLLNMERQIYPAGVVLGSQPIPFKYAGVAAPVAAVSRGMATIAMSNAAAGFDTDGKAALIALSDTRRLAVTQDITGTGGNLWRATVYELNGSGAPVQQASATFHTITTTLYPSSGSQIYGGFRVSNTAARFGCYMQTSGGQGSSAFGTYSATYDEAAKALSVVVDRADPPATTPAYAGGGMHRRRGYLCGAFAGFFPFSWYVGITSTQASAAQPTMRVLDRIPGSTRFTHRYPVGVISANAWAFDQLTDRLFVCLSDHYAAGVGDQAALSLVQVDDTGGGQVSALRLGNVVSGSVRLTALSATLIVGGYTTGALHACYAFARDPQTNALRMVGSATQGGTLSTPALEILPLSPTRMLYLTKGSNGVVTATVYEVDLNAAAGASAFVQIGQSFNFTIGTGVAGWVASDAVIACAVEQGATGDTVEILFKNTTRSPNVMGYEVFALA